MVRPDVLIKLRKVSKGLPNLNYKLMRNICSMPIKAFSKFGKRYETPYGEYFFKDNDAKILAVAHLDTVQPFTHFAVARLRSDHRIFSPTLDDRAGAYLLIHYLQLLGLNFDLLLTTGEEKGQSTAEFFKTSKEYRWMFSFDRGGDDVVMYQYGSKNVIADLNKFGFTTTYRGINSDIAHLDHLGCKGFNFGVGYYDYHSPEAWLSKRKLMSQLLKFKAFFIEHEHIYYPYNPDFFDGTAKPSNMKKPKLDNFPEDKTLMKILGRGSEDEPQRPNFDKSKVYNSYGDAKNASAIIPLQLEAECTTCHKSFKTTIESTYTSCEICRGKTNISSIVVLPKRRRSIKSATSFIDSSKGYFVLNVMPLRRPKEKTAPYNYVKLGKGEYEWQLAEEEKEKGKVKVGFEA